MKRKKIKGAIAKSLIFLSQSWNLSFPKFERTNIISLFIEWWYTTKFTELLCHNVKHVFFVYAKNKQNHKKLYNIWRSYIKNLIINIIFIFGSELVLRMLLIFTYLRLNIRVVWREILSLNLISHTKSESDLFLYINNVFNVQC